jgi:biofilm protein TabA
MIHDTLAQAARYHALHPRFATAFAWAQVTENCEKPDGRYLINGEDLFVIVESGSTMPAALKRFESHRKYIDIQVNLSGPEIMEWMPRARLTVELPFTADNDICFYQPTNEPVTRLLVRPGEFAIFFHEDAHKPCCHPHETAVAYRKLVFKVARQP